MSFCCRRTEPNLENGLKSLSWLRGIICWSFQIDDFFGWLLFLQLLISILGLQLLSLLLLIDFEFSQGIQLLIIFEFLLLLLLIDPRIYSNWVSSWVGDAIKDHALIRGDGLSRMIKSDDILGGDWWSV